MIQKRALGTSDCAEQSWLKAMAAMGGLAHDAGGNGSPPLRGNHDRDRNSRAARSDPSNTGLACPTRCMAAHAVRREGLCQDGALIAVWARPLGRDRTLREDSVLQVRWDTRQAAPAMAGRPPCRHQWEHFFRYVRGAHAARTVRRRAPNGRWCEDAKDGRNS